MKLDSDQLKLASLQQDQVEKLKQLEQQLNANNQGGTIFLFAMNKE